MAEDIEATDAEQQTPTDEAPEQDAVVEDAQHPDAEEAQDTQDAKQEEEQEEGDGLPENEVAVEDAGTWRKQVTVTIARERIDAKRDEMFGELAQSAQVPGFRVGHAPRRLVEKRFGKEVNSDVRNALLGEALGGAIEKTELKTLGEPDIDLDAIELPDEGEMSFSFEVEVVPEFEMPELTGIAIDRPKIEITDEKVTEYLDQLRQGRAVYVDTDKAAAEGDHVTAGARITGEGIEPVDRPGLDLRVAPGQIEGIPLVDLGKKLKRAKAGKTVSMTVTVPAAHPNEEWREKELTIEITVSQVRRRELPELDAAFAEKLGFDSVDELREFVKSRLEGNVVTETSRAMRSQVQRYLLDNTEFDLPEGVAARHTERVLQRRYIDLLRQGVPRETVDERMAELQAAAAEQARQDLQLQFILAEICEQKEIEVTEDEVNARVASMAGMYNRRPERMRQELEQDGSLDALRNSIAEDKALDLLLADADITDVTPDEAAAKDADGPAPGDQDE